MQEMTFVVTPDTDMVYSNPRKRLFRVQSPDSGLHTHHRILREPPPCGPILVIYVSDTISSKNVESGCDQVQKREDTATFVGI